MGLIVFYEVNRSSTGPWSISLDTLWLETVCDASDEAHDESSDETVLQGAGVGSVLLCGLACDEGLCPHCSPLPHAALWREKCWLALSPVWQIADGMLCSGIRELSSFAK